MGKREKQKQKHDRSQRGRGSFSYLQEQDHIDDTAPHSDGEQEEEEEEIEGGDDDDNNHEHPSHDMPSKFLLYQQSVQVSADYLLKNCPFYQWGLLALFGLFFEVKDEMH